MFAYAIRLMLRFYYTLFCVFLCFQSTAQLDTNYVANYKDRLVISTFQAYRYYDLALEQAIETDSNGFSGINYIARGNNITGFGIDYDKISISFGFRTPGVENTSARTGTTRTRNFSFSLNAKKFRFETSFRRFIGFYDNNTGRRDTSFNESTPYVQNPDMFSRSIRVKAFYFVNKKNRYSYASAYANTERQLRTAGSVVLTSNFHNFLAKSDRGFIPASIQEYYGAWGQWDRVNVFGLSFNPGYSFNLVILKRFFLNLTVSVGAELQYQQFGTRDGKSLNHWNLAFSTGDIRSSLGFNNRNFFIALTNIIDHTAISKYNLTFNAKLISGGLALGYRFPLKENKVTTGLKENKYYRML